MSSLKHLLQRNHAWAADLRARNPDYFTELAEIRSAFGSIASSSGDDDDDVEQQGAARPPESGEFRELDRYRDTVLSLPTLRRGHLRLISAQDARFADGVDRDGRLSSGHSRLHISDPEAFWASGRYLVLLIER